MKTENEQRAIAMAMEFASEGTLNKVFWQTIFGAISREAGFDFCELFDPEFRKKELLESTIFDEIRRALPKDKKTLIDKFTDAKTGTLITWQTVSFYIGVAWARRLAALDSIPAPLPTALSSVSEKGLTR